MGFVNGSVSFAQKKALFSLAAPQPGQRLTNGSQVTLVVFSLGKPTVCKSSQKAGQGCYLYPQFTVFANTSSVMSVSLWGATADIKLRLNLLFRTAVRSIGLIKV